MTIAQRFIPIEVRNDYPVISHESFISDLFSQLWVPFFNAIQFVLGVC